MVPLARRGQGLGRHASRPPRRYAGAFANLGVGYRPRERQSLYSCIDSGLTGLGRHGDMQVLSRRIPNKALAVSACSKQGPIHLSVFRGTPCSFHICSNRAKLVKGMLRWVHLLHHKWSGGISQLGFKPCVETPLSQSILSLSLTELGLCLRRTATTGQRQRQSDRERYFCESTLSGTNHQT